MQLHMESMRNFPYSLDWLLRRLNFTFIGFGFRIGAFLFCFGCFGCVFYLFSIVSLFLAAELQLHRSIWKRTAFHLTFGFQCILCVCVCDFSMLTKCYWEVVQLDAFNSYELATASRTIVNGIRHLEYDISQTMTSNLFSLNIFFIYVIFLSDGAESRELRWIKSCRKAISCGSDCLHSFPLSPNIANRDLYFIYLFI